MNDRDRRDASPYLRKDVWEQWAKGVESNIGRLYWFAGTMVLGLVSLVVAAFHGRLG